MATLKGPEIEQEARKEGAGEPLAGAPHQERQQPPALLALPDFLLTLILDHLTLASDLSSAAATCSVLRELANTTHWRHIGSFVANSWAPGMPGSLRWAAGQCPQLRHLDISGACACCDADLLPLAQLFTLTSLQLAGLWRIQGSTSSGSNGSSGRRRSGAGAGAGASSSPALDVLAAILGANRDLLTLDLSGTAVPIGSGLAAALAQLRTDTPNATRAAYGMQQLWLAGCQRAAGDAGDVLRDVLLKCLALTSLDLSGCRWITAETLPQDDDARSFALELLPLRHMSFAGCERLSGIGWLLSRWEYLETVDLSGTAVDDADVQAVARRCPWLHSVNLSGCIRIKGPALLSLATSMAVQAGILTELRIADLAWVSPEHLASLLQRCMHGGARKSVLRLDLSGCGGLNNDSLLALVPLGAVVPWLGPETPGDAHSNGNDSSSDGSSPDTATRSTSFCIEELRLAGSSRLTAVGLLQLVQASNRSRRTLLHGMCHLDVSHVQCLGSKAASSDTSTSAAQTLSALLEAAGSSLRILAMDGCFAGAGLVPTLVHCCHNVESLSLVGCTGLGDAELGVLTGLHKLRDLAVGGASLAWHEHRALTGLSGLTRLRIARRPFLTDAQLAPLLVTNRGSLVQLELAGCAALTDAVLLHLLPGHAVEWQGQQEEQAQPEVDAGSRRAQQLRQQRQQQRLSLRALQLVCCDRLIGSTLRHLVCLRSLRLNGCPCISGVALQAAAICCTQLTLLELPNHVPRSVVPVVPAGAASPLLGLQVLGGVEERGGARVCVCVDGGGEASEPLRTLKRCVSTAV